MTDGAHAGETTADLIARVSNLKALRFFHLI